MITTLLSRFLAATALLIGASAVAATPTFPEPTATDRILVVSPHPDDESLCCAGYLQRAIARGAKVAIVWVTAGDGFELDALILEHHLRIKGRGMERLGHMRINEAFEAGEWLGIPRESLSVLGYPDRGLAALFGPYFDLPYHSAYTRTDRVPYARVVSPGARYLGRNLERDLTKVIDAFAPTLVLAAAPEDLHTDHATSGRFALKILTARGQQDRLRYWLVHAGSHWPRPRGLHTELPLTLPPVAKSRPWQAFALTSTEQAGKVVALEKHRTQWDVMAPFLRAFVRENELFALASAWPDASDARLTNTYWKLIDLQGTAVVAAENQREAQFVLHDDGSRMAGSGGCNRISGTYALNGEALTFGPVVATRMACVAGGDLEQRFVKSLARVAAWQIAGQNLVLRDAQGDTLAHFEAVYLR